MPRPILHTGRRRSTPRLGPPLGPMRVMGAVAVSLVMSCGADAGSGDAADTGGGTAASTTDHSPSTTIGQTTPDPTDSSSGDLADTSGDDPTGAPSCDDLPTAITADGMRVHLEALEAIAVANGNTRSVGTPGYDLSVEYVRAELEAVGYVVDLQQFDVNVFSIDGPASLAWQGQADYQQGTEFQIATYSAGGAPTAIARAVDLALGLGNASSSGCEASDFDGFVAGSIALVQRGACLTAQKVLNAQQAGAVGVILFNQGDDEGRTGLWTTTLGAQSAIAIPVLLTPYWIGESMAQAAPGTVSAAMDVDVTLEMRPTINLVVETPGGDPDEVVMLGAHLDSVPAGPGINDNGTGSAALLEVARALAGCETTRKVRFGWWAAEEVGLVGSTIYVESLDAMQRASILTYMNFDMIGSPNYVRFRYDGDGSGFGTTGPMGSAELEQVFADYFDGLGLVSEEVPFDGRSDYGAFIANGIAAGGLFTGAEGIKSDGQADVHGGAAGIAYDACYHAECDGADNVDYTILEGMGGAIAHAVALYAMP